MIPGSSSFHLAIRDFQAARQRAGLEEVLARLKGKSNVLLSYDAVAQKLRLRARSDFMLRESPVPIFICR